GMAYGTPLAAYEFLKQPFQLAFQLESLQPYYSVDPVHELLIEEAEAVLTVRCPLRFDRGSISELLLEWPAREQEGWRATAVTTAPPTSTGPVSVDPASQAGTIRLAWPRSVGTSVDVIAEFRRPVPDPVADRMEFSLPMPKVPYTAQALLLLDSADPFEVR